MIADNSVMRVIQRFCFCVALIFLYTSNGQAGRWTTRDPLEFMERDPKPTMPGTFSAATIAPHATEAILYRFVDNNPINEVDPLGLWGIGFGNNNGSTYFNIGWGNPSLYFSPDAANGLGQSAAATADGFNPFGDPLASHGFYDPCKGWNRFSHSMGKVAQASVTSATGLGALRAANGFFMPSTLYHFTSVESAASILAEGEIQAGTGFSLYGPGVYLTGFNNATIATLQGAASTEAVIPIATEGLTVIPTYFPGTYLIRGTSLFLK